MGNKIEVMILKEYPDDLTIFFDQFANKFNDEFLFAELGPREDLSSTFISGRVEFKISFETQNSSLIVYYIGKKIFLKKLRIRQFIISTINKVKNL